MQISPEDLEEFKRIYKAEYGEELTQAEASEAASNLVDLYMLLAEPLPSEIAEMEKTKQPSGEKTLPPSAE
jgi:hypothetical protein